MKKKMLAVLMAACVMTSMTGCGNSSNAGTETTGTTEAGNEETTSQEETTVDDTAAADGAVYKIGICNYVDDASLNQIVENIQSRLEELGTENGVT